MLELSIQYWPLDHYILAMASATATVASSALLSFSDDIASDAQTVSFIQFVAYPSKKMYVIYRTCGTLSFSRSCLQIRRPTGTGTRPALLLGSPNTGPISKLRDGWGQTLLRMSFNFDITMENDTDRVLTPSLSSVASADYNAPINVTLVQQMSSLLNSTQAALLNRVLLSLPLSGGAAAQAIFGRESTDMTTEMAANSSDPIKAVNFVVGLCLWANLHHLQGKYPANPCTHLVAPLLGMSFLTPAIFHTNIFHLMCSLVSRGVFPIFRLVSIYVNRQELNFTLPLVSHTIEFIRANHASSSANGDSLNRSQAALVSSINIGPTNGASSSGSGSISASDSASKYWSTRSDNYWRPSIHYQKYQHGRKTNVWLVGSRVSFQREERLDIRDSEWFAASLLRENIHQLSLSHAVQRNDSSSPRLSTATWVYQKNMGNLTLILV